MAVPYIVEQIIAAVETFKAQRLNTDAAVAEVADWYNISKEYVYRCLRQ
ncbi:hypothetical protein [Rhizobium grahamii]|nr:hypothetical protein [Rhizobium grahamii]